ncbi:MAG TPA: FAD-dependent oxidoreductase [Acidimicrobiales bacterium]|nr:FAD-dependent oxidoreductase [Acidimicrobiales bacterium]
MFGHNRTRSLVMTGMRTDWDVIVVGAGLAGLAAGATAAAAGASTLVLEATRPGGRARTVSRAGYVFNMGAHALYLGGPGTAVLRALGAEPHGVPSPFPRYRLLRHGELHVIPSGPANLLRTTAMGRMAKAQFGRLLGLLPAMRAARLATTTVDDWLAGHSLRPDAEAVVRALIRLSTYTADTDEMSADAVVRQLQIGARPGVVYLHGGWAQLIDGLGARVQVEAGAKVSAVRADGHRVEVEAGDRVWRARRVIVAAGPPAAVRSLLPADPGWAGLGRPVTAACLDLGTSRVPRPGYVLSADGPLMGVTQSPPARQAPEGGAVVAAIRYGATEADADRLALDGHVAVMGLRAADVVTSRFLARMVVAGATPTAASGGLAGRPGVTDSGQPGVLIAGDWVGPVGLLADAALASGHAAARLALARMDREPALVA